MFSVLTIALLCPQVQPLAGRSEAVGFPRGQRIPSHLVLSAVHKGSAKGGPAEDSLRDCRWGAVRQPPCPHRSGLYTAYCNQCLVKTY